MKMILQRNDGKVQTLPRWHHTCFQSLKQIWALSTEGHCLQGKPHTSPDSLDKDDHHQQNIYIHQSIWGKICKSDPWIRMLARVSFVVPQLIPDVPSPSYANVISGYQ